MRYGLIRLLVNRFEQYGDLLFVGLSLRKRAQYVDRVANLLHSGQGPLHLRIFTVAIKVDEEDVLPLGFAVRERFDPG